jgi:CDP-diacylglycerol--glycerol-3-phosphate 3-phosphatidyltransferase
MLSRTIGAYLSWPINRLARIVAPTGIPPNFITSAALCLNLWAGILFSQGRFAAGGGMMILAGLCDRFLDSILDRYADLILFLGLLVYYASVNRFIYAFLAGAAMAGAVMVSYAKARAESLVPNEDVGFWDRPERLVLMILGALANRMPPVLWILAIGPNITVIHRIVHTWKQTKEVAPAPASISHPAPSPSPSQLPGNLAHEARPASSSFLSRTAGRGR